jgi:RNA polymerase-binding transcription factor DksA
MPHLSFTYLTRKRAQVARHGAMLIWLDSRLGFFLKPGSFCRDRRSHEKHR